MAQAYLDRGVSPTKDEVKAAVKTRIKVYTQVHL